jgi:hypothetical protein
MVRRLEICRVDVSVVLLSLRVVGWSGFGELGRSLLQYEGAGRAVSRIKGNFYGRIKREGQASRLFGMYQKACLAGSFCCLSWHIVQTRL